MSVAALPRRIWRPQLARLGALAALIFFFTAIGADGVPPVMQVKDWRAWAPVLFPPFTDRTRGLRRIAARFVSLGALTFSVLLVHCVARMQVRLCKSVSILGQGM